MIKFFGIVKWFRVFYSAGFENAILCPYNPSCSDNFKASGWIPSVPEATPGYYHPSRDTGCVQFFCLLWWPHSACSNSGGLVAHSIYISLLSHHWWPGILVPSPSPTDGVWRICSCHCSLRLFSIGLGHSPPGYSPGGECPNTMATIDFDSQSYSSLETYLFYFLLHSKTVLLRHAHYLRMAGSGRTLVAETCRTLIHSYPLTSKSQMVNMYQIIFSFLLQYEQSFFRWKFHYLRQKWYFFSRGNLRINSVRCLKKIGVFLSLLLLRMKEDLDKEIYGEET